MKRKKEDFFKLKKEKIEKEKLIKTYKGEWYTINSILGNDWARFFYLLGGREAGKSYSVMKWISTRKLKNPKKVKIYWFRLSEASQKKLLADGANDLIDPDLKRKFNLKITTNGNKVLTYKEKILKNGKIEKYDKEEFCRVMACSTFYNDKGIGYFDKDFDGEYYCVLDEMNREQCEKNTFDIVYAFVNQLENVLRSVNKKVKVIMIGNTLEEASDLLSNLNFIPDHFGRFKLKRKLAVVDYIKPNEAYNERRKEATANIMLGQASTFTNKIEMDRSLLTNKRNCTSPTYIIKFLKGVESWFTLWNDKIIKSYNKEEKPAIAMQRYLDEPYYPELVSSVMERFDNRNFLFTTLADFKRFQKYMKLIVKKK